MKNLSLTGPPPKGYRNSRIKIPHINHNYKLANFLNLTDNTRQTIANNKTITTVPNQAAAAPTLDAPTNGATNQLWYPLLKITGTRESNLKE